VLCLWSSATMPVYCYPRPFALPDQATDWQVLQPEPQPLPAGAPAGAGAMHPANQVLVRDLLAAVETGRQPNSSGHDARAALEMIMAVYASHIQGQRVPLPLEERQHPLARWTAGA
ncbi:MAG: hypothetical protein ACRDI2_24760, partial [Chloroflexota bacterium]